MKNTFGLFLLSASAGISVAAGASYALTGINDLATTGANGCFNVTDYNFEGMPPADGIHEGYFCLSMATSEELTLKWDSISARRIYSQKAWVLGSPADSQSLDVSLASAVDEAQEYTTTLALDHVGECPEGVYNLKLAAYALYADVCVPGTDAYENGETFVPNTDLPTWVQDVNNVQESEATDYTYITIPMNCEEVPDERAPPALAPPKEGSGFGDPHFETWTGDKFDYHGECDLVLIDNPAFMDGLGLKLHVRTTRISYYSYIEKIALQIGDDVLEFANDVDNFLINGKPAPPNRKRHKTLLSGFLIRRGDKKSISVRLSKTNYKRGAPRIDFITRTTGFPAFVVKSEGTDIFDGSLGLLGDFATGKRTGRDGTTVFTSEDATDFAMEWQVRDTEPQLFKDARAPQFPAKCIPPAKVMGNRLGSSHMRAEAEEVCKSWGDNKDACVFDVMATRDMAVAKEGSVKTA